MSGRHVNHVRHNYIRLDVHSLNLLNSFLPSILVELALDYLDHFICILSDSESLQWSSCFTCGFKFRRVDYSKGSYEENQTDGSKKLFFIPEIIFWRPKDVWISFPNQSTFRIDVKTGKWDWIQTGSNFYFGYDLSIWQCLETEVTGVYQHQIHFAFQIQDFDLIEVTKHMREMLIAEYNVSIFPTWLICVRREYIFGYCFSNWTEVKYELRFMLQYLKDYKLISMI